MVAFSIVVVVFVFVVVVGANLPRGSAVQFIDIYTLYMCIYRTLFLYLFAYQRYIFIHSRGFVSVTRFVCPADLPHFLDNYGAL